MLETLQTALSTARVVWPTSIQTTVASPTFLIAQTVLRATLTTHHNMFEHWATYAVLLGYLATSFFWLARLNTALRDFDALFIVPLLQVCVGLFLALMMRVLT
jgi:hypothetical protein